MSAALEESRTSADKVGKCKGDWLMEKFRVVLRFCV
jgi:hypothetical protein